MTVTEQSRASAVGDKRAKDQRGRQTQRYEPQPVNVGKAERAVSVAAGAILALSGISRRSLPGLLVASVGGALIYRGSTGHCPVYNALELDTAHEPTTEEDIARRGIHVNQAMLINKPAEELYRFWRDFNNLPRIMRHVESVQVKDDRHSHWVVRAEKVPGGRVEWDAEITRDQPNEAIAWRSQPGSQVDTAGEIRFAKALGDRGTEVHVSMDYVPPAGRLGKWVAQLFGQNPSRLIREDLRNFKRLMEIGEVLTIEGQPHGTCTGRGAPYSESGWRPLFAG